VNESDCAIGVNPIVSWAEVKTTGARLRRLARKQFVLDQRTYRASSSPKINNSLLYTGSSGMSTEKQKKSVIAPW
jgi:hypothetical protein